MYMLCIAMGCREIEEPWRPEDVNEKKWNSGGDGGEGEGMGKGRRRRMEREEMQEDKVEK